MCDKIMASREHVPPQSFFPKGHRTELITVPSCRDHNLTKSKDDEYVRFIITSFLTSNAHGQDLAITKGLRSLERSGGFISAVFRKSNLLKLPDGSHTVAISVDLERWTKFFEHLANAIYFHDFKHAHTQNWDIINFSLVVGESLMKGEPDPYNPVRAKLLALPFAQQQTSNPEIFRYFFYRYNEQSYAYKFLFYEGFAIYALTTATGVPSHNTQHNSLSHSVNAP
jgi:hypothetical protein